VIREIKAIATYFEILDFIGSEIQKQKTEFAKKAAALSAARKKISTPFVNKWEKGVRELGMPHATFALKLKETEEF
jgi:DNA repair ATPase RecN